jgi:hypothetical protein
MIEFTKEETELMERLSVVGGWDDPEASQIKAKIIKHLRERDVPYCCYCRVSMQGWHNLTIDPEHVLPKKHFPGQLFKLANLNIACKRCNMGIKGQRFDFFLAEKDCAEPFKSELYTIIHPNLDQANDHLHVRIQQANASFIRKYWVVNESAKGNATYSYFRLNELEVESLDESQGLGTVAPNFSPAVVGRLAAELNQE